jgi:hypothetical protein
VAVQCSLGVKKVACSSHCKECGFFSHIFIFWAAGSLAACTQQPMSLITRFARRRRRFHFARVVMLCLQDVHGADGRHGRKAMHGRRRRRAAGCVAAGGAAAACLAAFRSLSDEDWEAQGVLQVKALAYD